MSNMILPGLATPDEAKTKSQASDSLIKANSSDDSIDVTFHVPRTDWVPGGGGAA